MILMTHTRIAIFALVAGLAAAAQASEPAAPSKYPTMAPLAQYTMAKDDEIALARSAAPPAIASTAEVMLLTDHGYKTVIKGSNGFVCLVDRAWANDVHNDGFWNPKLRGPLCLNPAAVRSVLPAYLERTKWVLAGASKTEIERRVIATIAAGHYTPPAPGAMAFMLSKMGYLGDDAGGPWHPHLMFFQSTAVGGPEIWGANVPGSQVVADANPVEPFVTFFIPVAKWSDGTLDGTSASANQMNMQ
jgi:hypothetical protein